MLNDLQKAFWRFRGAYPGSLNGVPFRFDPLHTKFWRKCSRNGWEPETFDVLDGHLSPDHDYLDIGAWIGPTVLYAAKKARKVWAFEPDREAFRALDWNLSLNGLDNVGAFAAAVAGETGVARMASFRGEPGDSMTSLLNPDGAHGMDVLTLDWAVFEDAVDLSKVSLVKLDVEGAEFDLIPRLLPWLKKQRPALYLSTHGPYLPEAERADALAQLADALSFYPSIRDVKTGTTGRDALTGDRALQKFPSFLLTAG
ncbi:FkbM family methyltransferase [Chachezhania antarctica]|uniref:FkbM family methyltransferase n=1 Tax=Chachezhania antarctica TaxID=2340860 RepID=UPI000EB097F8|nr:FkbM family methyltransferase [Chachezhania antarctica]|tara:strand:+ start:3024 stop:3791 length:768 start_codon:yes stop_codon:yes gene_type:complete